MVLAVVIPVLNEATSIESTLARLQPMRARGARVIVVDGGSTDATAVIAAAVCRSRAAFHAGTRAADERRRQGRNR